MRALIINVADTEGGAAIAGYTLCSALNKYTNFKTEILCGDKYGSDNFVHQILPRGKRLIERGINKYIVKNTLSQEYLLPYKNLLKKIENIKPDVVNIHNVHGGYLSYRAVKEIARMYPLVISMHDMWLITGHCAYSYDCDYWKTGCKKCPYKNLYQSIKYDNASFHFENKKKILQESKISFVTGSDWMKSLCSKSPILKNEKIVRIYDPIDMELTKPVDKKFARELLSLPEGKNVVFFGASDIGDPRKGFEKFLNYITEEFIKENNLFLIIVGNDSKNLTTKIPDFVPYKYLGSINHPQHRAIIYGASDCVICPTIADNLPLMIMESIAAGRPVVTFKVGGCHELINEKTGYAAIAGSLEDFFKGLKEVINSNDLDGDVISSCRNLAESNWSMIKSAEAYASVFNEAIRDFGR